MNTNVKIHPTATLNEPFRNFQGGKEPVDIQYRPGSFGHNVSIGAGAVIGIGVILETGVVIDHQCIVEPNATIGHDTLLIYRAIIGNEAVIGSNCVIGGFIAERCIIGNHCRIFGQLVHRQADTTLSWDEHESPEPSAQVHDHSFIGFGAVIAGGVTIGPKSYVCAGAIITRDVPPGHIAVGVNRIIASREWSGNLQANPLFGS
jgi:UDP-3-O-[3-hydroxymyristoyl] glucosamine N-acyltransferase